jgi:hypothetical protein
MKILKKVVDFFLCMLKEDCVYSIKKFLTYVFSLLVIYLILFTTKDYYQILAFIGLLLGIRAYEKNNDMKVGFKRPKTSENPEEKQVL